MDTSKSHDLHQSWLHQTVMIFRDSGNRGAPRGCVQSVGSSSNAQSRSDARSPSDGHDSHRSLSHLGYASNFLEHRIAIRQPPQVDQSELKSNVGKMKTRSRCDRGPITMRSWPDHHAIVATIKRNHGPLHRRIKATLIPTSSDGMD